MDVSYRLIDAHAVRSSTKSNQAYFAALQRLTAEGWLDH